MSDYTICYDNKLNKVYLKKSNQSTDNKNMNHIPYDSYENTALTDLNNQLNNIYDSKNNYDANNYDSNNYPKPIFPKNNNELVEVDSSLFFEKFKSYFINDYKFEKETSYKFNSLKLMIIFSFQFLFSLAIFKMAH